MADIILADDDKNNRFVISAHLRLRGHQVREAGSGAEALSLLAAARPDLVLLDLMMPELNGCETCRRMRQVEGAGRLPILALTALEGAVDSQRVRDAGFDGVAVKPIAMDELHRIIGDALTANAAG